MKKLLLFFVLLDCSSGWSQTNVYHPFPDSNAVWRYWQTQQCNPPFSPAYCGYNYQYILKGDTLISAKQYAKVYKEEWYTQCAPFQGNYTCSAPIFSSTLTGGLRNDTATKKVYYINSAPETLLYEFNLQVGDTIKAQMVSGSVVIRIDSVFIGGNYRKRFTSQLSGKYTLIEGIGLVDVDSSGWGLWADLFYPGPCACSASWGFDCFWQDGVHLYGDTGCSIISSVPTIAQSMQIRAYPNPTNNEIILDFPGELSYTLYTALGKSMLSGRSKKINVVDIPTGIYFLLLENKQRFKIIVQH